VPAQLLGFKNARKTNCDKRAIDDEHFTVTSRYSGKKKPSIYRFLAHQLWALETIMRTIKWTCNSYGEDFEVEQFNCCFSALLSSTRQCRSTKHKCVSFIIEKTNRHSEKVQEDVTTGYAFCKCA